ncbi:hypothetical protein MUO32_26625 [Shinella sp. CPCC 101442]|uniref:hypothetical protein n=1 Tax=Shinella sp. CPCC 101442 TaxID=2932265 RepID=UPI0021520602|nr:hypothetical protein [Shinella sp. CPCC 101442]MCR6502607.1 hypothetical protein [Shinella sp. CPCC 101442]
MTQIDIHPAVARQEDAALLAYYKNRNLVLAQLASGQSELLDTLGKERDELACKVDGMAADLAKLKTELAFATANKRRSAKPAEG